MTGKKYKFQITVDSDSVLISQSPKKKKSRVILANLGREELEQIAQGIINSGLKDQFVSLINERDF